MAFWLFKSEPFKWSWEMQKAKGEAGQQWDGVRNYQARNNMRAMQIGDKGFFYHSNEGLEVVGIVEVCALAHHDTTTDDPALGMRRYPRRRRCAQPREPGDGQDQSGTFGNGPAQEFKVVGTAGHRG